MRRIKLFYKEDNLEDLFYLQKNYIYNFKLFIDNYFINILIFFLNKINILNYSLYKIILFF